MPVALEEAHHLALEQRRERAGAVLRRQVRGSARAQRFARRRILSRGTRDVPERQVHLRRRVVRQTAKDGLHLARPGPSADHAIGDGVAHDSRQDDPDEPRKESRRERQDEPLVGVEPVGGGLGKANLRDGTVELAKHSLSRRVRPQHRANRVLRRTGVERCADEAYS